MKKVEEIWNSYIRNLKTSVTYQLGTAFGILAIAFVLSGKRVKKLLPYIEFDSNKRKQILDELKKVDSKALKIAEKLTELVGDLPVYVTSVFRPYDSKAPYSPHPYWRAIDIAPIDFLGKDITGQYGLKNVTDAVVGGATPDKLENWLNANKSNISKQAYQNMMKNLDIVKHLNKIFPHSNPKYLSVLFHNVGSGWHYHIQV